LPAGFGTCGGLALSRKGALKVTRHCRTFEGWELFDRRELERSHAEKGRRLLIRVAGYGHRSVRFNWAVLRCRSSDFPPHRHLPHARHFLIWLFSMMRERLPPGMAAAAAVAST
jgi:hypothetical protein